MMDQPLLSVIVPCYNVEPYIDKCIASIVGQKYANLEIILVDDGSTDRTGKICDEWQKRDPRISVIHKQNEGAACARITGIENASAEYVAFVDSDDWIDTNMYAELMSLLLTTNSDIAHCVVCFVYEDGQKKELLVDDVATIQIFSRIEGVLMCLKDRWWVSLSSKIYKKKLFGYIEIPKGRIYGEDKIDHLLLHQASQTVLLNRGYYFYFQRKDSISREQDMQTEMKKLSDVSDYYYDRVLFVNNHAEYHDALPYLTSKAIRTGMRVLCNIIASPHLFPEKYYDVKVEQMRSISMPEDDSLKRKIKYEWYMLKISPKLYKLVTTLKNRCRK